MGRLVHSGERKLLPEGQMSNIRMRPIVIPPENVKSGYRRIFTTSSAPVSGPLNPPIVITWITAQCVQLRETPAALHATSRSSNELMAKIKEFEDLSSYIVRNSYARSRSRLEAAVEAQERLL